MEEALSHDYMQLGEAKFSLISANTRGQKIALVQLDEKMTHFLIKEKIKIGWVVCRITLGNGDEVFQVLQVWAHGQNMQGSRREQHMLQVGNACHNLNSVASSVM